MFQHSRLVVHGLCLCALVSTAVAQTDTTFTYQCVLKDGGAPVSGTVDITVRVFNSASGGLVPLGTNSFPSTSVTDGLVALNLDFGASVFNGSDRWLEIEVDGNILLPRQQVLPTPYAMHAHNLGSGGLGSTYTAAVNFSNGLNEFAGDGSGLTGLDASNVNAGNLGATFMPTGGAWTLGSDLNIDSGTLFVDAASNRIGMGTTSPGSLLEVRGDSEAEAIYAYQTAATGITTAVYGRNNSTDGKGVFGSANAASGTTYGVYGQVLSPDGVGVYGVHNTTSGSAAGVLGETNSTAIGASGVHGRLTNATPGVLAAGVRGENPSIGGVGVGVWGSHAGSGWGVYGTTADGSGVYGAASGASAANYGVRGATSSTQGIGVYGEATAGTGNASGVSGRTSSTTGRGVHGEATAASGTNFGVYGESASVDGRGVYGWATATSGSNYGVLGWSDSTSGTGCYGLATTTSGTNFGIYGKSNSTEGTGAVGWATASSGITDGVLGRSDSTSGTGVYGYASASSGVNVGVYGESESATGYDFFAGGAGQNYGSGSSRRWKRNIVNIDYPLQKIAQLRGVYFDWDEDHGGHHDVGFIAEEVGAVLPEIVNYEANGVDAHGMDYSKMTPLLVEAVNALRTENEILRADNDALHQRLDSLEEVIANLAANQD